LAATGIYGVMSYLVTQGSREIGIRMALGATSGGVLRMVLARGLSVAMTGLSVGVAAAFGLTRWMESLLYGVSASDALTFTAASGVLLVVAAVACWLPARRASRVDPLVSLRME
jgi:ABC-type antimicrobial peptide transport system permease subunit